MKNKGFTLIELLAVISIMAIMAVIATPNIINMLNKGKKEQFITDASTMISKAKYRYLNFPETFSEDASTGCKYISIGNLGLNSDDLESAYYSDNNKEVYNTGKSKVYVCSNTDATTGKKTQIYKIILYTTKPIEGGSNEDAHCLSATGVSGSCSTPVEEVALDMDKVVEARS